MDWMMQIEMFDPKTRCLYLKTGSNALLKYAVEPVPNSTRNRFHTVPGPGSIVPETGSTGIKKMMCTRVVPGPGSTDNPVPITCIHTRFRVGTGSGF
ncbi:hypothetical protein Hanom_Chr05g00424201 [Helianthus anomalus]